MNTATNVSAGKPKIGGAIFRAPLGTALPTNATVALNAAFKGLGFVSDAGLTNSAGITSNDVKSWGGNTVMSVVEDRADKYRFTAIEALNPEVLKAFYGDDNVSGELATGITVQQNLKEPGTYSWVFDMIMRNGALKRIVLPAAELSETGDIVYVDNQPVGYPMTLTATPDEQDNTHYEYIQRPAAAGGTT